MDELLDDLASRLADAWFEYDVRSWDRSPSGTLRAPVYIRDSQDDRIERDVQLGSAKTAAINALPDGLEVEGVSEGYHHFEVRLADSDDVGGAGAALPLPDDVDEIRNDVFRRTEDADLWVTDIPICLNCHAGNPSAYGGARETVDVEIDGETVELVGEECHKCEQATVQLLRGPK